ncbi:hypothetical protein DFH06DRAFT_1324594 [Mycena polygramma]|nr:hypothetical protein DFH06DRAFT_1324594 [Mycena polygramma]
MSFPTVPIFPNLRVISSECGAQLFPYLRYILGPQVTNLTIEIYPVGPWLFAAFPCIASTCPYLRHVALYGPGDDEATDPISTFVAKLLHLQTLTVLSVNTHAYQHISNLRSLEALTVHDLNVEPFPPGSPSSESPFPALRDLSLSTQNIKFATNLIGRAHNAPLGRVSLSASTCTAVDLLAFFSTFSPRCSPLDLTRVDVHLDEATAHTGNHAISPHIIQPLLEFPNLRNVALTTPPFDLDADFVTKMALAWTEIEYLNVVTSRPSIMCLLAFSRHCPRLRHLSFPVDATDGQMVHPPITPRTIQTALERIFVGDCPIESPVQVAQLLSSIFPSLDSICGGPSSFFHNTDGPWDEVERLVPVFAAVRADERQVLMAGSDAGASASL